VGLVVRFFNYVKMTEKRVFKLIEEKRLAKHLQISPSDFAVKKQGKDSQINQRGEACFR
jgi:hypothetical protein